MLMLLYKDLFVGKMRPLPIPHTSFEEVTFFPALSQNYITFAFYVQVQHKQNDLFFIHVRSVCRVIFTLQTLQKRKSN